MDIKTLQDKYKNKEITIEGYISQIFQNIEENDYNAYISLNKEEALDKARKLDHALEEGKEVSGLFGVPLGVKDNILTKDLRTTGASKALKDFIPIYDADVISKIKDSGAIIIGKTNMDEFAMGASSETSYFGPSKNPYDTRLTPGGSSSGSAAAVAGGEALVALGTDTGGSVRNPADFCHIVGFAPSYGAISRYGIISMANSLDRVGLMANNVSDIKILFDQVRGKSSNDFTSVDIENFDGNLKVEDLKIAFFELKDDYMIDPQIKENFNKTLELLKSKVQKLDSVSVEYLEVLNEAYTAIMAVEVEGNMAKIDGLRYGNSVEEYDTTDDFYINNRTENFGKEVKRRIALGNFFASKDNGQKYYKKAMQIRYLVKEQMDKLLDEYDLVISPTTTLLPKKVGETSQDAYASFDSGLFNIITNLSNLPAISIPMRKDQLGSIQLMARTNDDLRLLEIAKLIEGLLE